MQKRKIFGAAAGALLAATFTLPQAKAETQAINSIGLEIAPYGKVTMNEIVTSGLEKGRMLNLVDKNGQTTMCLYDEKGAVSAMAGWTTVGHLLFIKDVRRDRYVSVVDAKDDVLAETMHLARPILVRQVKKQCNELLKRIPAPR